MPPPILTVRGALDPGVLAEARSVLLAGELILYPTDTFYAIGGCVLDPRVATAVRRAKGREENKPLPVIAADIEQLRALTSRLPPELPGLSAAHWPGPLTLVLPAAAHIPPEVTAGTGTIAVRIPASALARALCTSVGPLISTSANRAGEPPSSTCAAAVEAVGEQVALALDGGQAPASVASTIVALRAGGPVLLRAGAVPWEAVLATLARAVPR